MKITVCVGVAIAFGRGLTFEKMYGEGQEALLEAKKKGEACFAVRTDKSQAGETGRRPGMWDVITLPSLLDGMEEGVCLLEVGEEILMTYASPGYYRMLGPDGEAFLRVPCRLEETAIHPEDRNEYEKLLRRQVGLGGVVSHIHRMQDQRTGRVIWRQARAVRIACPDREMPVMLEFSRDITGIMEKDQQIREDRERLRVIFGQDTAVLWEVDLKKRIFTIHQVRAQTQLHQRTLENSINESLRCIGEYYQADRAYILGLSGQRQEVTLLYEWNGFGKNSIRQAVMGKKVQKIPILMQCLRKQETVCVEKPLERGAGRKNWYFIVSPLMGECRLMGFLCVENARLHAAEGWLLKKVTPYMMKEHVRFQDRRDDVRAMGTDNCDELANLRDFQREAYALTSDRCSSMGALTLDIPNFSVLNGSFGFLYGRNLLKFITEALTDIFGGGHIYRIWDTEFAVLLPDTVQNVFLARCIRLRTRLQRLYPDQIRIGYTWSDGVFSARNLVREAQAIMKCEKVARAADGNRLSREQWFAEDGVVPIKKYIPYFQPKVDMRDGKVIGAEALARGLDENGGVVTPDHFIEPLEKNGGIRELDFYMLESVLRQMQDWEERGYSPLKVSVNISRRTLFDPTALASVLAIESRYPEDLAQRVDLEITETAGDVQRATLAEIVNRFREFGVEFELDDFGSHYANMSIFSSIRFSTIKLDRSLIMDLPGNDISRMMVENIAHICRIFGMSCVAEGVETQQQQAALLKAGCVYGQGYFYAKPMPSWKFEEKYLRGQRKNSGGGI